ncbi:MAG: signal peptidase II [Pseudomonadota bacterium]
MQAAAPPSAPPAPRRPSARRNLTRMLGFAVLIFALDQAIKLLVVVYLDLARRGSLDVLPPFLNLRMAWNRGVNFGLFASDEALARWALIALALAICVGLAVWLRHATGWRVPLFAGAIIGGALGNALDRAVYGAVADFLNMSCCGILNPFSFNIADVAIFAGVAGLLIWPQGPGTGETPRRADRPADK